MNTASGHQNSQDKTASMRNKFELHGRSFIVTGGAMGIGFQIVKAVCEMGGNVAVLDLRQTPLEPVLELAKQCGVSTHYVQADVSDEDSLRTGFEKAVNALGGRLDGIVTAAGIALDKPYTDQGWEEVNRVIQVNVRPCIRNYKTCTDLIDQSLGSFFSAQMAVKRMQKQGTPGSVVMIASITSHCNLPGYRMAGYVSARIPTILQSSRCTSN